MFRNGIFEGELKELFEPLFGYQIGRKYLKNSSNSEGKNKFFQAILCE
jgi:hypothetical protein